MRDERTIKLLGAQQRSLNEIKRIIYNPHINR